MTSMVSPSILTLSFDQAIKSESKLNIMDAFGHILSHYNAFPERWTDDDKQRVFAKIFNSENEEILFLVKEELFLTLAKKWSPSFYQLGALMPYIKITPINMKLLVNYGVTDKHVQDNSMVVHCLLGMCLGENLSPEFVQIAALFCVNNIEKSLPLVGKEMTTTSIRKADLRWDTPEFQNGIKEMWKWFDNNQLDSYFLKGDWQKSLDLGFTIFNGLPSGTEDVLNILEDLEWFDPYFFLQDMSPSTNKAQHNWDQLQGIYDRKTLLAETQAASLPKSARYRL